VRQTSSGIAYDDRGSGKPALILLPGWCGPRTLFDPAAALLESSFRTLAVDWRGHGDSESPVGDFGFSDLVEDAVAVIDDSEADEVVPVAAAHAGWVAIELRRRLGAERVQHLVFLDWMVLGAPPPFLEALAGMAAPATTRMVVDQVSTMWLADLDLPALSAYVASMTAQPDDMWARAAREVAGAFERFGSPLEAVAALDTPPATLHLYAQPADPEFLDAQRGYAEAHPWFEVEHLDAASHFPVLEVPDAVAAHVRRFVGR
jgi:pimeloyl-ACP methyl ester carboxylesterase